MIYASHGIQARAADRDAALKLCRGHYQIAIVSGDQNLSGSDLTGNASRYGLHYRNSRAALLGRLRDADLAEAIRGPNGSIELLLGSADERAVWLSQNKKWRAEPHYLT